MKKCAGVKLALGSLLIAGSLTAGALPVAKMAFNPQPDPPGRTPAIQAAKPLPMPLQRITVILAFNPQPDPPGRS
jgi:hypothetical protein